MRIRELDGLRGIAVLAVIDCHYMGWLPVTRAEYGWLGVDLFFVLSGFLITSILLGLREKQHYFSVFYSRRALRIFPPYFLGLAVYLVIAFAMKTPGSWKMWLSYILYYAGLTGIQPNELTGAMKVPMVVGFGLTVLWSLSVEEIYYTLWAPIVRFTQEKVFASLLAAMLIAAPLLRWRLYTPADHEIYTFYCRMDGLAFGSAVALLVHHRRLAARAWAGIDAVLVRATVVVSVLTVIF